MKNYTEAQYWNEPQDDITIIFLDKAERDAELAEIEAIESELKGGIMTKAQAKKIEQSLAEIDIDVLADDLEALTSFDEITEYLRDNDLMNVEIIYYARAMEYLTEHDPSLKESLELANDMGYSPENLSSEILASLLASQNLEEELSDIEPEITEILEGAK